MAKDIKDLSASGVRFTVADAGCERLFMRADGDIKNQTYVGVLAKLLNSDIKEKS